MNYTSEDMERFNFLSNEIEKAYHETALKFGLSDSAMLVLYAACNGKGSCFISEITNLSGTSKQTINSALRKLEKENVIYLKAHSSKKKEICLTESGKVLAENTVAKLINIENEIFGSWSDDERQQYIWLTQRYLTEFKNKIKTL